MNILIGVLIGIVSRLVFKKTRHYLQEKKDNNKQLTSAAVPALSEFCQEKVSDADKVWTFALNCSTSITEDQLQYGIKNLFENDIAKYKFTAESFEKFKSNILTAPSRDRLIFRCIFEYMVIDVDNVDRALSEEEQQFVATALILQERIRRIFAEEKTLQLRALAKSL